MKHDSYKPLLLAWRSFNLKLYNFISTWVNVSPWCMLNTHTCNDCICCVQASFSNITNHLFIRIWIKIQTNIEIIFKSWKLKKFVATYLFCSYSLSSKYNDMDFFYKHLPELNKMLKGLLHNCKTKISSIKENKVCYIQYDLNRYL